MSDVNDIEKNFDNQKVTFKDKVTGEEIIFDVLDELKVDGIKYILVADADDNGTIMKQTGEVGEEIEYEIVEDDLEFNKLATLFAEPDDTREDYKIEL